MLKFYATHKYTNEPGGSQDNQYKDVQQFHEESRSCLNSDVYFLSITDGAYYLTRETSLKGQNIPKLIYLNSGRYRGDRNIATTTNQFVQDIVPLIVEWLQQNFATDEIQDEIEKLLAIKNGSLNP